MLRRNFLKQTGAAALAVLGRREVRPPPALCVHASDKAGAKNAIIGSGRASLRMLPRLG